MNGGTYTEEAGYLYTTSHLLVICKHAQYRTEGKKENQQLSNLNLKQIKIYTPGFIIESSYLLSSSCSFHIPSLIWILERRRAYDSSEGV